MKSAIVITGVPVDLQQAAAAFEAVGRVDVQSSKRFVVEGDWGWLSVNLDDVSEREFDDHELSQIRRVFPEPHFVQIEYGTNYAANLAIDTMPLSADTFVVNDAGKIAAMVTIRQQIAAGLEWHSVPN